MPYYVDKICLYVTPCARTRTHGTTMPYRLHNVHLKLCWAMSKSRGAAEQDQIFATTQLCTLTKMTSFSLSSLQFWVSTAWDVHYWLCWAGWQHNSQDSCLDVLLSVSLTVLQQHCCVDITLVEYGKVSVCHTFIFVLFSIKGSCNYCNDVFLPKLSHKCRNTF